MTKDDETKKEELISKSTQMVQNTPKRAVHDEAWNRSLEEMDSQMGSKNTNDKDW